jgi:hypothetical protein
LRFFATLLSLVWKTARGFCWRIGLFQASSTYSWNLGLSVQKDSNLKIGFKAGVMRRAKSKEQWLETDEDKGCIIGLNEVFLP